MDTRELSERWHGPHVETTWPQPALMPQPASGRRRMMTLRWVVHRQLTKCFAMIVRYGPWEHHSVSVSFSAWQCWKDMRMRSNVWPGPHPVTCWLHVAETRVSGSGRVSAALTKEYNSLYFYHITCVPHKHSAVVSVCCFEQSVTMSLSVFLSGWGGWVWVCERGELSYTGCQACCLASNTGGTAYFILFHFLY